MKNVTKILTAVVLCAALFASQQRVDALGGNAAMWDDEANTAAFPAQVNNHAYLQFTGVADGTDNTTGGASLLFQNDGTTWGFNYGANDDWVNMSWGDGNQGVTVGMESTTGSTTAGDASDMSVSWGSTFAWGEVGVHYETVDNGDGDAMLGVDFRRAQDIWLFDNLVVSAADLMADDLAFGADFFTHMDAGGADIAFGWGANYNGAAGIDASADTMGCDADGNAHPTAGLACDDAVARADVASLTQTATIGVEANMTDWATLRAGYNWSHELACDNGNDLGGDSDDNCGGNASGFSWGLGFNWGGLIADFTVNSTLLQDPIGTVTGFGDGGLTDKSITLTYSF